MIKASGEIGSRSVWLAGLGYVRVVRSLWFVTKCRFESCLAFKIKDKMEKLYLSEVKERFELYKVAFNQKPHVSNLAKELGVKTTTLMKFIVENDKHFQLHTDNKGTYVSQVYVGLEYIEYNKKKYKNTIFLEKVYSDYSNTVDEWANTPEKIDKIKDYLQQVTFFGDGYSGGYTRKYDNYLSKQNIKLLMSQGWKFENYDENSDR